MRWVKASKKLPEYIGSVHWRDAVVQCPIGFGAAYITTKRGDLETIEWLDESPEQKFEQPHPSVEEINNAIKEIGKQSTAPDKETPDWMESDILHGINWAINWYKSKLEQPTVDDGWISVEDSPLPEPGEEVLFMVSETDMRKGVFLKEDQWGRKNMFCDGSFFHLDDVLFWRKLPEPPKK